MNGRAKPIVVALLALFVASAALTPAARAESRGKQTAEAYYEKGMKAYTLGHFPEAIAEFEKAYELRAEPIFLYNIAQSHRQDNNLQRAIFFYRRYLEAQPDAKNRPEIEQRIRDMETQLSEQKEHASMAMGSGPAPVAFSAPVTPPPAIVAAPPASVPAPQASVPAPQAEPPAPVTKENPGRGLRIAGITTAAVGVVGVGLGVAFGLHANTLHDEAYNPRWDAAKLDSSKTYRTLEWVSFSVGGAAIVAGGLLYYFGWSAGTESPVALAPMVAPGSGGAVLYGRF
jgi:tetratricopeptide (TPR) repeat protein